MEWKEITFAEIMAEIEAKQAKRLARREKKEMKETEMMQGITSKAEIFEMEIHASTLIAANAIVDRWIAENAPMKLLRRTMDYRGNGLWIVTLRSLA